MIDGFVSATRSETISRDGALGCHAITVMPTTEHQRSDATAGCAPSAHGENPVSGFSAPTISRLPIRELPLSSLSDGMAKIPEK